MATPNRSSTSSNRFQQKPQRKIQSLPWVVMMAFLFGLYFLKDAAFSSFEASSISDLSSVLIGPKKHEESLKVWDWKTPELGDMKQHMEFVRIASELVPRKNNNNNINNNINNNNNKYYGIQHVHRDGLIHSGMGVAVLDTNITMVDAKILLLKRAQHLVTCPNAWSLVGEHTHQEETPRDTVLRGIKEELGDAFHQQFVRKGSKTMELLKHPVYANVDYNSDNNGSPIYDRQITYLHAIEMNTPLEELQNMLELDDEVAETRWMTRQEIQDGWMNYNPGEMFCSHELALLLQLVLHRLEDLEREANKMHASSNMRQ